MEIYLDRAIHQLNWHITGKTADAHRIHTCHADFKGAALRADTVSVVIHTTTYGSTVFSVHIHCQRTGMSEIQGTNAFIAGAANAKAIMTFGIDGKLTGTLCDQHTSLRHMNACRVQGVFTLQHQCENRAFPYLDTGKVIHGMKPYIIYGQHTV